MTTMTAKQTLVNNALDQAEALREKRRHHLEAGRPRLADAFLPEIEKLMSIASFIQGLSDKDAETVKRLLA